MAIQLYSAIHYTAVQRYTVYMLYTIPLTALYLRATSRRVAAAHCRKAGRGAGAMRGCRTVLVLGELIDRKNARKKSRARDCLIKGARQCSPG